jgi:cyclophilin family peptidyl-prolyl cis-trans isomerase
MKIFKVPMTVFLLALLMSATSCNNKHQDLEDGLYAEIITNKGTMLAKLEFEKAPVTVANFVALAEGNHPLLADSLKGKKFYNGIIFHRVIDKFMIQGGDPTGTGSGSPGFKFEDEFHPDLKHDKPGILSMANSGPATNGSQFFITEVPTPNLDNRHAVFGELVKGLEVQDSISNVETNKPSNKPVDDVVIQEVNIIRVGLAAKKFDAPQVFTEELPKIKEKQEKLREEQRLKAEEQQKIREAQNVEAAKDVKPLLDGYLSKAKASASGLKTYMITKGTGEKPSQGANVKVNYEGYFTDGRLFDSNRKEIEEKHGMLNPMKVQRDMYKPMPMQISADARMIAGFKEAVTQLKVGDKAFFYLPYHLAYGERANGPIPAKADLIFIIEMVEIVKPQD